MTRRICVVAGASGFVGRWVVPALRARGLHVRCGSRHPERAAALLPDREWVLLDVEREKTLGKALAGADSLIYLVHQMGVTDGNLLAREEAAARRVLRAAERSGVRRIIYLGGPQPPESASAHLAARIATGTTLRSGSVSTIELQAAMIIGTESQSWMIVRDLALRLPVMVLPSWLSRRSEPIAVQDVVTALVHALDLPGESSRCLPLPGPEIVSARQILTRIAACRGIRPLMVPVPVLTPSLSSHWIRWVTRADYAIARHLVDGLCTDLIADKDDFWSLFPNLKRTPLDEAIRATLDREPVESMPLWQRRWERIVRRSALRAL